MTPKRLGSLNLRSAADKPDETCVDLTFAELVQAHELAHPEKAIGPRLKKWVEAFSGLNAWALTPAQIHKASREMVKQGYTGASANRDVGALGQVYLWAIKKRRIAPAGFASPTLSVPRHPETIRKVTLSAEELQKLRFLARTSFKDKRFGLFVLMVTDSGARKSEILERRWSELDLEGRRMVLQTTKNGESRTLFFSPETIDLARKLKPKDDGLIFAGHRRGGDTPINYRKPWGELTRMVGREDLHIHDMRHACAASLLAQGVTIAVTAQILGHKDHTILTRRYGHLETGHLARVMDERFAHGAAVASSTS